ncbi:MAG TPA: response regulator transcription factor [Bryobacteraceae bacterium]|nr:response regulator transcription factor [Bryobacteraceae bacterium]
MYTVLVCDAEPVAIAGVRSVLAASGIWSVSATETSLDRALQIVRTAAPSLLLVDRNFGISALMESLKVLRDEHFRTAVVVWGVSVPEAEALRFLQAGARGVIRKTAPIESLLECLSAACAGETWVEPGVLLAKNRPARLARACLTARELQVMELVERGMKNKDIAVMLGIRTGTVKIHLRHIFEKTGIRGRYGLALSGLQAKGLLALPVVEAH